MLDQLSFVFFKKFSLTENILLKKGYAKLNQDGMVIGLKWEEYALSNNPIQRLIDNGECKDQIEYLCKHPPKKLQQKQQQQDYTFVWVESNSNHDINALNLVKALKQLRNNLFHGAKYKNGVYSDLARTEKLLECGNSVIDELLKRHIF